MLFNRLLTYFHKHIYLQIMIFKDAFCIVELNERNSFHFFVKVFRTLFILVFSLMLNYQ